MIKKHSQHSRKIHYLFLYLHDKSFLCGYTCHTMIGYHTLTNLTTIGVFMKTKFIATSAIVAMLAMFGTAHANTTKPAKADTHECKPPHEHGKKGERPNGQKPNGQKGDRPELPKDANGKPIFPKDANGKAMLPKNENGERMIPKDTNGKPKFNKGNCQPPKDGQKSAMPTPKSN